MYRLKNLIDKLVFHLKAAKAALLVTINGWPYFVENIPEETIILSMKGGLGNQIFIHSFGLHISHNFSKECLFDTVPFCGDNKYQRTYKLDKLGVKNQELSLSNFKKLDSVVDYFGFFYYLRLINKLIPIFIRVFIHEADVKNIHSARTWRKSIYFDGYWQKLSYNLCTKKIVQSEILSACKLSSEAEKWLERIQGKNSVSIHVRQVQFEHKLSSNYYLNACTFIRKKIPDVQFYIFSDDWEWVQQNLAFLNSAELIKCNSDIDDFYLLLLSKNMIIANSTFSWWAAYLKYYEDSMIIVPKSLSKNLDIPHIWIQIED